MIIAVSELCALVNSEKIRNRGLYNKLVTVVFRNIAAGFTKMLLQNSARSYGARINTNLFKLTSNVWPSLHQLVQDTKIVKITPWKISRSLHKPQDKCAKYRHKLILKPHNHTIISIPQPLSMKIGEKKCGKCRWNLEYNLASIGILTKPIFKKIAILNNTVCRSIYRASAIFMVHGMHG